ncbi:hypothetical protein H8959_012732 [Pygathrix nigripes]
MPTFDCVGLVVPVDENDVGDRELPETDGNIFHMQFVSDGTSVGSSYWSVFCFYSKSSFLHVSAHRENFKKYDYCYFHKVAGQLLPLAYNLLKRNLFAETVKDHLANRSKENIDQLAA